MAVALEDASIGPVVLLFRQLALQSSQMFGSRSLKNWACLPGITGPPRDSRSTSERREPRHRSCQKRRPAPGASPVPLRSRRGSPPLPEARGPLSSCET